MLILCFVLFGIAAWGFQSALLEAAKHRPQSWLGSVESRFAVDPYIWSDLAPQSLRRRYAATTACGAVGLLCFAWSTWTFEQRPDRQIAGVVLAIIGAAVTAMDPATKIVRHGL